jgi:hypothetical protein
MSTSVEVNEAVAVSVPDDAPRDREFIPAEATVGTLTVTNEGPFTRALSLPQLSGCLAGQNAIAEGDVYLNYEPRSYNRPAQIAGGESHTFRITARLPIPNGTNETTYAIEQGSDCDTTAETPTLIILNSED